NLGGELIINAALRERTATRIVKAGPGTIVFNGANAYAGQTYANGGTILVSANAGLGASTAGATGNLAGGGVMIGSTTTLDNAGAHARPFAVAAQGGFLAASSGNVATIPGVISGAGALTFGTGTLPGTGAGTANTTAVNGNGTISLTGTSNTYSGSASVNAGTLRLDNAGGSALGTGSLTVANGG